MYRHVLESIFHMFCLPILQKVDAVKVWLKRRLNKPSVQRDDPAVSAVDVFIQCFHHVSHLLSRT